MNLLLSTLVLAAGLTQASSGAAASQNAYERSRLLELAIAQNQASEPQDLTNTIITSGEFSIGEPFLPEQAQENVLVVPTPDLPAGSLAELTEDLTVMCRIFDKSLPTSRVGSAYGDRSDVLWHRIGQQTRGAQGLYLDGYGALFFVYVDYPLAPTEPQDQAEAKAKESGDSVWSQTIREMTGQPQDRQQIARKAQPYDPLRVENLKKTLVKTLAHASNIRMRRPQDVITLVAGAFDDDRGSSYRTYGAARTSGYGTALVPPGTSKSQPGARNPTAALLVMRVPKAEVDAFAKGQLTLAQFTDKVQSLLSPMEQATPAAGATAPTSVSPRR